MATNIVQTAGPVFALAGSGNDATDDFTTNPATGRLVFMAFGGNKNSGTFTNPSGFTTPTNGSYVATSVSARIGYASGVDGGTLQWTGQAEGALAFFEFDAPSGWAHRVCAQTGTESSVNTLSLNPGTSPVDGIAIALVATDSSTGSGGPFATSATIGFTNGYTFIGRFQEAAPYGGDAGGASFIIAVKQLTSADRTTNTVWTTTGSSDQCVMIIEVIDVPPLVTDLTATSIPSGEAFGTAVITTGAVDLAPTGIAPTSAMGTSEVSMVISPVGIASAEAFGVADLTGGIRPTGIPSGEAFGTATVAAGDITLTVSSIVSAEAFGLADIQGSVIACISIPSGEAFGTSVITTGSVDINPAGIPSQFATGSTTVAQFVSALRSEVLVRPRPKTSYEVVWMAKIPQQNGPPSFFAVDPLEWTSISYTEQLSAVPTLDFTCQISTISDAIRQRFRNPSEMATEIWVYRNGKIIFAGPLAGATVQGEDLNFTVDGLMTYLGNMLITRDTIFKATDQFAIAKSLVDTKQADSYGNYGILTSNIGLSGITMDKTYLRDERNYILPKIQDMAKSSDGFDITINSSSRSIELYHPYMGVDRSSGPEAIIFDDKDITDTNIVLSLGLKDIASDIHAVGTGTGQDGALVFYSTLTNNDLLTQYGRSELELSFRDITSQGQLDALVLAASNARVNPLWIPGPNVRVTPNADVSAYNVGDTVFYRLHHNLEVQGAFRLLKRTVHVARGGDETVSAAFV